jgi:hypothetical protein
MPFSQSSQISTIVQFGEAVQPASILDVGVGMGQYGFLFRTNLENVGLFDIDGANATWRPKDRWRIKIDGIEGCKDYLTPVHDFAYNQVLVGDALECLAKIPDKSYELVIAIDILEHFWKVDGWRLLSELSRVSSRAALVSTPKIFCAQEFEANPLETHRSVWSSAELAQAGFTEILENGESWVATFKRSD